MASAQDLSEYEDDPRLFLFTSLTAGSSHIITATSRLETILKANKIPFQAIDIATDEKARRLWQRRAQKKKLPGLVKDGFVIGDLEEIEEWNEFGELKENIGPVPAHNAPPAGGVQGVNIRPPEATSPKISPSPTMGGTSGTNKAPSPLADKSKMVALPGAEEMAARNKAQQMSSPVSEKLGVETFTSSPEDKKESINAAKALLKDDHPSLDHLSAPASAIQSGTATPQPEPATAPSEGGEEAAEAQPEPEPSTAPSEGVGAAIGEKRHRGSEVIEVPLDQIKKIESESALKEEDEDGDDGTAEKVEGLKVDDVEKPQDQDAKAPEDAATSVGDQSH